MESYKKIEKTCLVKDLVQELRNNAVILELCYDSFELECEVNSYTLLRDGTLQVYSPIHTLATFGERGTICFDEMNVTSAKEWTELFLNENYYLNIQDEFYFPCEYQHKEDQIKYLLSRNESELYISYDKANFYGPLECDFIEWWIKQHPDYHTDRILKKSNDFEITESGTLVGYNEDSCNDIITIPAETKRIGQGVFRYSNVKEVIISEGVFEICSEAFYGCRKLDHIYLPYSVKRIGDKTFSGCYTLKDIKIPRQVVTIEPYTFSGCSQLEKITLPNTIKSIKESAFSGCVNLKTIDIPQNIEIEFKAFSGCAPAIAKLSPKFRMIKGRLVKADTDVEGHVCIPNGVRVIAKGAFEQSLSINEKIFGITIPKSVSKIESHALSSRLKYLIICAGKRMLKCEYDLLDQSSLQLVFHCGRDIHLSSGYRWCDEKLIFVGTIQDKVFVRNTIAENNDRVSRFIINNKEDINTLINCYNLKNHTEIIEYLSTLFV